VTHFIRAWRQGEGQVFAGNAFMPHAFDLGEAFQKGLLAVLAVPARWADRELLPLLTLLAVPAQQAFQKLRTAFPSSPAKIKMYLSVPCAWCRQGGDALRKVNA